MHAMLKGDKKGFTLIEVLVAVVILATGITVILRAFETAIVALDAARDRLVAAVLVRGTVAEIAAGQVLDQGAARHFSGNFSAPYQRYGWRAELAEPNLPGMLSADSAPKIEIFEINAGVGREDVTRYFGVSLWDWRFQETDEQ